MKPSGHTLVFFALADEAKPFREIAAGKSSVSIFITGIGPQNAKRAVESAFQRQGPEVVFTCGFAGALNPSLAAGDVLFSTADPDLGRRLVATAAKSARFVCAAKVAITAAEKRELRRATGADAVEMESGVIQRICRERGVPCATVRAISDAANEDLPLDFNALANADLSLNYGKLAWAIAKSPGKIPALLRLQRHSRFAAQRLADVLHRVLTAR